MIGLKREKIIMYGKEALIPRDTAWYGDKSYVYSGIENKPLKWTTTLIKIKDKITDKINSLTYLHNFVHVCQLNLLYDLVVETKYVCAITK